MTPTLRLSGLLVAAMLATSATRASAQVGIPAPPPPPPPPPLVQVGQPMPDFALPYLEPAPDGARPQQKTAKLSDFVGKQVVVLAFFPAAFSPG
jgi:hypothetical protein